MQLTDEQGKRSSARTSFWTTLVFTLVMIAIDGLTRATFPGEAYTLLGSVLLATAAWAGGPRVAQYLAPQIAGAAKAIAAAGRRRLDDRFKDDERGEVR